MCVISLDDFIRCVQQICIGYIGERSVNGFAVVSSRNNPLQDNAQSTFADFERGYFWARDWYNSGAQRDTLQREFPLLLMEIGDTTIRDNGRKIKITIAVLESEKDECPEGPAKREIDLLAITTDIVREIGDILQAQVGGASAWMSKGYFDFLAETSEVTALQDLELEKTQVKPWQWGADNFGWAFDVYLQDCPSAQAPYLPAYSTAPKSAQIMCPVC